ncbi:MAG: hypothetical protein KDN22_31145 [Verrucomicrobiae bacterium]|nr:hypothetical protein [Verrucomicrobiae bacterium]
MLIKNNDTLIADPEISPQSSEDAEELESPMIVVERNALMKILDAPNNAEDLFTWTGGAPVISLLGLTESDIVYCNDLIEESLRQIQSLESVHKKRVTDSNGDEWIEIPPMAEFGVDVRDTLAAKLQLRLGMKRGEIITSLVGDVDSFSGFWGKYTRRFSIEEKRQGDRVKYIVTVSDLNSAGRQFKSMNYHYSDYAVSNLRRHYGHLFDQQE